MDTNAACLEDRPYSLDFLSSHPVSCHNDSTTKVQPKAIPTLAPARFATPHLRTVQVSKSSAGEVYFKKFKRSRANLRDVFPNTDKIY